MTEMVERASRAHSPGLWRRIDELRELGDGDQAELEAGALERMAVAIAAMREPTVAMYEASRFANAGCLGDQWRAMIDAALGEGR